MHTGEGLKEFRGCTEPCLTATFLQVAIAALYYDPAHFFATINNNPAVIGQFIDQWLNDTDCFIGIHDRKLCILGLCQLLGMPNVPGVADNAKRMLPSLIMLFEGLKRAYESLQDSDDDSDEETDDDDEEEGEVLESDEDEIDDEGQMYLESLQKKVNKAAAGQDQFQVSATIEHGDDDDDSDDEDDDLFEETNMEGYTTPIDDEDAVDEYHAFKATLEALQANHQEWYSAITADLSQDQAKHIQEILTLYQQRKAARESKSIEKAGGYNFTQNTQVCIRIYCLLLNS